MRRLSLHLALACAGVMAASPAAADNILQKAAHSVARDWARNNYWPEPFIYQDRDAAVAPFGVMIAKGWQVQNTLTDHHFHPGTSQLADSGVLKVQQILTETDPHRRTIFVQTGPSPQQTMARMAAVRAEAVQMLPDMEPTVYPTSVQAHTWPADYQYNVNKKVLEAIPAFKLPAPRGDGGTK